MDCTQFLREERARKLAYIQVLMSGDARVTIKTAPGMADISAQIIRQDLSLVAEIERILAAEGTPLYN